jgi:transitional endoplasmic reticulum ATPase
MQYEAIIQAIEAALLAKPDDLSLRQHLGDLLFQAGRYAEAEKEYRQVLLQQAHNEALKLALAKTFFLQGKAMMALVILEELLRGSAVTGELYLWAARAYMASGQQKEAAQAYQQALASDSKLADPDLAPLMADQSSPASPSPEAAPLRLPIEDWGEGPSAELERATIDFSGVGGMEKLKEEIRLKIIYPLQKPEIYRAYGKQIGGGILMYGPPGCGKTHLARATAGEVQAYFLSIGLHDVLNMYLGQSEQNLHSLFQMARRNRPCVMFIDEADALGANRTDMRQSAGRMLINQLLSELDGIEANNNAGLLVLAATNAPWHLDPALRRPGRFDRMIFVPPPDGAARQAILQILLRDKPQEAIAYADLAGPTDGFSGADLKSVVDIAIEAKLEEALRRGLPSPLTTRDLLQAARRIKPSTKEWFSTARNYALYANESGTYDDILEYLRMADEAEGGFLPKLWRRK